MKDINNNAKNSATFSKCIRNVPIEYEKIMVSFDVTSFYLNISIIDMLSIMEIMIINLRGKQLSPTVRFLILLLFPTCLIKPIPSLPVNDWTRENAIVNQVLKENEYQESIISKIFMRITNNHSLSQSQQQI